MTPSVQDAILVREAFAARTLAYAPYSHFLVGAALLSREGRIFRGCNIESASYSPSNCAERTAFFKAVSEGERDFSAIAIVGGRDGALPGQFGYCYPCGVCRQVMLEFCDPARFRVLVARSEEDILSITLAKLLPHGFGPQSLA